MLHQDVACHRWRGTLRRTPGQMASAEVFTAACLPSVHLQTDGPAPFTAPFPHFFALRPTCSTLEEGMVAQAPCGRTRPSACILATVPFLGSESLSSLYLES